MASKQASKRNMTLLGVLAVLVVVAIGLADPFGWFKPNEEAALAGDPGRITLVDLKADEISSIEIKPADSEAFTLTRETDEWWVVQGGQRYRANMDRLTPMLDQLPGARSESVATSSAERYEDLEVTAEKAIGLRIYAGGPEPRVSLLVGKAAEGFKACFVRTAGEKGESKEVYRSGVNIKQLISFAFDDYRTMKPWAFDPAFATEITLRKPPVQAAAPPAEEGKAPEKPKDANGFTLETWPAESLTFSKNGEFWQVNGKNANQNLLKDLLQKFADLQINEYLDNPTAADTGLAPDATPAILVKTPRGDFAITLGPDKTGSRSAMDAAGLTYRVSSYPLKWYLEDLQWDQLSFDDSAAKAAEEAAAADEADKDAGTESADTAATDEAAPSDDADSEGK